MIMDTAQTLAELEALRVLKAHYFRFVDTHAWADFAGIFEPDVVAELPVGDGVRWEGAEEIVGNIARLLEGVVSIHHGHMPELELTSPTTARGIWAMQDILKYPNGSRMTGYGHYHETYVKRDGRWRIATMKLTRLSTDLA
jgi:uncharacterized protein (TIGR02246 family)